MTLNGKNRGRDLFYLAVGWLIANICTWQQWLAEIPVGPDAPTGQRYADQETQFLNRLVIEPYLAKRAEKESKSNDTDPGEQFLRRWITATVKGYNDVDVTPVVTKGKQAADAGCTDPMFAYCYGRVLRQQGEHEESAKHLRHALENLEAAGYDVTFCAWAANQLALALRDLNQHGEAQSLANREIEYLVKTVAEGPYLPDEQPHLYRHIEWVLENHPIESVERIVEAIDPMYPWLSHMASGRLDVRQAWAARGGGWARDVTEEGWKGFRKNMKSGRKHLEEAWRLNPEWPEAPTKMITVAMGGHAADGETPRLWFDRAVAAQLDYKPAYTNLMWSLMPRWGGSHMELYALGRECLETGRFDTNVPHSFFEAFEYIVADIGSDLDFYQAPGVYEDLQAMCDGYLAEKSMERHHMWYRTLKVSVAVRCEKWDDARRFLLALDHEPHENAFARLGLKQEDAIGEIHARTGDFADPNTEAEKLAASGKFDEARAKFEELATKSGDQKRVTTYFRGRLRDVEFDRDFTAGKWTKLPLDEQLIGWRNLGGKWTVDDEGRLVGEAQTDGLRLMFERKLGTQYELRGTAVFVAKEHGGCNMGVFFGQHNGQLPSSFRIFANDAYAAILDGEDLLARKDFAVKDINTFRVTRRGNTITAYVNDELIARGVEIEPYGPPSSEVVALGGRYWYTGPVVRFEDLEIRKLDEPPAAEEEPEAESDAEEAEDS